MKLLTIRLRPLEPLMFRGSGEFDPSSRGVYSYAHSLILPRPSTMVGALISTIVSRGECLPECLKPSGWTDLLEKCYIGLFNKLGIEAIRGPFIIKGRDLFTPIRLRKSLLLVDHRQMKHFLIKEYRDGFERYFSGGDEDRVGAALRLIESQIKSLKEKGYAIELLPIDLTGIHLRSRKFKESGKTVEEGYIYTIKYVPYLADTEIVFLMVLKNSSFDIEAELSGRTAAVKVGGEDRVMKMTVESSDEFGITDKLMEITSSKYAVLVAPMPLNTLHKIHFIGEYSVVGYGFSIAKRRRKPLSPCVLEGSIIKLNGSSASEAEVLRYAIYGVLGLTGNSYREYEHMGRLGYASFVPLGEV